MNMVGINPEHLDMVFQLSGFLIELKIKYQRQLSPERTDEEAMRIVFQNLLDAKVWELAYASRPNS